MKSSYLYIQSTKVISLILHKDIFAGLHLQVEVKFHKVSVFAFAIDILIFYVRYIILGWKYLLIKSLIFKFYKNRPNDCFLDLLTNMFFS